MVATKQILTPSAPHSPVLTHAQMHGQHLQWFNEDALWREEVAHWQQETKKARADIERLTKALVNHEEILQKHAAAIHLYEQDMAKHEHALADYERGGEGADLFPLAQSHQKEAANHAIQRGHHETIKRDHHTMLAHWNLLMKELVEGQ